MSRIFAPIMKLLMDQRHVLINKHEPYLCTWLFFANVSFHEVSKYFAFIDKKM